MIRDHYGPRDKKVVWNMQSDHRVIQMTLLGDEVKKKKSWTPPRKREVDNPGEFGEILEERVKNQRQDNLEQMDALMADIAEHMPRKQGGRKQAKTHGSRS